MRGRLGIASAQRQWAGAYYYSSSSFRNSRSSSSTLSHSGSSESKRCSYTSFTFFAFGLSVIPQADSTAPARNSCSWSHFPVEVKEKHQSVIRNRHLLPMALT